MAIIIIFPILRNSMTAIGDLNLGKEYPLGKQRN